MGNIELIQTLKNINSIKCLVIENYIYRKDYISKWFSVLEVSREIMDYEQKFVFQNGKIIKEEYKCWCNVFTIPEYSIIIEELINGSIVRKHYNVCGELSDTTIQSEEEYRKIWGNYDIQQSYGIDAIFNEYKDIIFETVTLNGEKQKRTYEYLYDCHGNWVEKRTNINGKLENLTIRKFRYT